MIHAIPVVMSEDKYEAGCGVGDVGCMIEEQIVRWSIDLMNFVIDALDWALKIGSFNATDGDGNSTNDWLNAIGMTEVWIGIAGTHRLRAQRPRDDRVDLVCGAIAQRDRVDTSRDFGQHARRSGHENSRA